MGTGTHLVDLGSGDGQVLAAAARRGATVSGVEADPDLVAESRTNLVAAGLGHLLVDVVEADLLDPDLVLPSGATPADERVVWFSYLAPATLQRLLPALRRHDPTPLVTVDFDVPGLVAARRDGPARMYRLPGRARRVGAPGWPCAGTFVATVPDVQSLTCLELVHPGGPVRVRATPALAREAAVLAGTDHADGATAVAVDLRWEGAPSGTFAGGRLSDPAVGDHVVAVLATDAEDEGVWELSEEGAANLTAALRRPRDRRPATVAEVLDAADGSW